MKNEGVIEVYKTNIAGPQQRDLLLKVLQHHLPFCKINVDLQDCDKILRIASPEPIPGIQTLRVLVRHMGISIEALE
jgi:hypothetical protein